MLQCRLSEEWWYYGYLASCAWAYERADDDSVFRLAIFANTPSYIDITTSAHLAVIHQYNGHESPD